MMMVVIKLPGENDIGKTQNTKNTRLTRNSDE